MISKKIAPNIMDSFWLPLVPTGMGLLLLVWLLTQTEPGFHFSCDGALKEYNLWLWCQQGSISNELNFPNMPDWAKDVWRENYFPIRPPFEYRHHLVFAPFFQIITFPFYFVLGYAGLFVVPALSVVGLWVLLWRFWRREGLDGLPLLVGMSLLALSPLTFYGAIFWEHAPAVLLFVTAVTSVMGNWRCGERKNGLVSARGAAWGGMALVGAQVMRPEMIIGTIIVLVLGLSVRETRRGFFAGVVGAGLVAAGINLASTGTLLGIHHQQSRFLFRGDPVENLMDYLVLYTVDFVTFTPAASLAILGAVVGAKRLARSRREVFTLLGTILASFVILPFLLPNLGDFQLYRRYFLIFVPIGAMLGARVTALNPRIGWGLLLVHLLSLPTLLHLVSEHEWHFRQRIKPLYDQIALDPTGAVVSLTNDGVLDFIPMMKRIPFFQVKSEAEILDLMERIADHVAPEQIAFIFLQHERDPMRSKRMITLRDGRAYAMRKFNNGRSIFYMFRLEPAMDSRMNERAAIGPLPP